MNRADMKNTIVRTGVWRKLKTAALIGQVMACGKIKTLKAKCFAAVQRKCCRLEGEFNKLANSNQGVSQLSDV